MRCRIEILKLYGKRVCGAYNAEIRRIPHVGEILCWINWVFWVELTKREKWVCSVVE